MVPELGGTPGIWCWSVGGHYDDPEGTKATWAGYQARVRLFPEALPELEAAV